MKILRVIGSMNPLIGGPCQGIRHSIAELSKSGIYNEVVCLDDPTASFLNKDAFVIHALGSDWRPWQYSAKLLPWLEQNLDRFDVLIIHGLWLYPSYAAHIAHQRVKKKARLSNKKAPKLFIMPHGMLDPWFQEAKTRRLKAIRNEVYWKLIEQKVVQDADGLLFTTETELQMARIPFRPYQPKQEINVGYGIQSPPAYSQDMQAAFLEYCPSLGSSSYILFLSRIHEKKGVDLLVKAYAAILKDSPELNELPKLIIAGPGLDTPFGLMIQQLVEEADLKEHILFTGMLTGAAKWGALYGSEAFILPSHQENFGIAVAEALACGKPVLISNQVNIWQQIETERSGFVADNTLLGTRELVQTWLETTLEAKKSMSQKAKITFERYFAIEPAAIRFKEAIS